MTHVTLLFFADCPNWRRTDAYLRRLRGELQFTLAYQEVTTPGEATQLRFPGSPTILVDGRDPFPTEATPGGLSCRIYATPDGAQGSPTPDQLREALS